ncbi:MAG: hypothetical protein H7A53_01055 [Akkermansiaceae bacterium]|nr:hypothetical protein [Akkermansiaceae bacterium]MCP5549474.1 hypothetical protein [Akkermansiaceae bacterium]
MTTKTVRTLTILFAAITAAGGLFEGTARAQQAAGKRYPELGAMVLMADGKRMRGFVQQSNANGLLFTLVEGSPGTGYAWKTQAVAVAFDEENDIMADARAAWLKGDYQAAADAFGQVAENYANIAYVPENFATEARYYQIEAMRHLGKWAEMGPLMQTPTGATIETHLPEFFRKQHQLNKLWASLGAGDLEPAKAEVSSREKPVIGNAKLLPAPSFVKMPQRELVQIAFMRAKINEAEGKTQQALEDYYRVFTMGYAYEREVANQSMKAALTIQSKDPKLAEDKKNSTLWAIQSLAYLYKNAFGAGQIDPGLEKFAVIPELPTVKAPAKKEGAPESAPAKEGEKAPEAGDAPIPEAATEKPAGDKAKPDAAGAAKEKAKGEAKAN